jgi:hypothetical protein
MTVTLDAILKYCNYLVNKSQSADAISPDEFNAVLPIVNQEVFNRELNKLNRKHGKPFIDSYRDSYLQDCEIPFSATPNSMLLSKPADFERFLSGRVRTGDTWHEMNITDTLDAFSSLDGISTTQYLVTIHYGDSFKFNKVVNEVNMIYIKRPAAPYYAYTLVNFDYDYDHNNSIQFLWRDTLLPTIVNLIFEKMGVNMKDQADIQISQIKKQDEKR